MRICVVGDLDDLSATYVAWLAEQRGIEVLRLREESFGLEWSYRLTSAGGAIDLDDDSVALCEIAGAFVRLNPEPPVSNALGVPPEATHVYALERRHAIHWLLDHAPFPVVNRPSGGRSNGSKPFQMLFLQEHGLDVPRWTVTNDAATATRFIASCSTGAIYKSCSGLRSHVRRVDSTLLSRLAASTAPVLLQDYVPGNDVRLHILDSTPFATRVVSSAVDYRFDGGEQRYERVDAPRAIVDAARRITERDGLVLSGLDFRVDAAARWWCLELNPVPTFLPYEAGSGHPIGDAIVDVLTGREVTVDRPSRLAAATQHRISNTS